MKASEADIRFPVLAFTPDGEMSGARNLETLTSCGFRSLRAGWLGGLELVDAEGKRWAVRSARRIGPAERWPRSLASLLFSGARILRVEYDLEPMPPVTLCEVQERACRDIERLSADVCGPVDTEAKLALLLAEVRATRSIAELYHLRNPDWFWL